MSYLVFARKWRPTTFEDVVGQEHVTSTLKKALEKDRVAHAYIFSGTRGVGKTTTARILARALNCDKGPTPQPCGQCESCRTVQTGANIDVMEIDGASNNSVDDIRDLRDNVGYTSMTGRYRIIIIDEVHMLSKSAFNALLKTLEEPPAKVIFIFATTEPQKIPATIQSRCQRYDFRRISSEQIRGQLEKICDSDGIKYEKDGLALIARRAEGSMRDGLSLLDQVASYGHDVLTETEVRGVLGIVDRDVYSGIMEGVADRNPRPPLDAVQQLLSHGFDLHEFTVGLEEHIRNLLFARLGEVLRARTDEIPPEVAPAYQQQALRFSEGTLLRMAELVRKTQYELKWSSFPRFLIETMLLKMVHMDDSVSLEKLLKAVGEAGPSQQPRSASPAPAPAPEPAEDPKKKSSMSSGRPPAAPRAAAPATPSQPSSAPVEETGPQPEGFPSESPSSSRDLARDWPLFVSKLMDDRPQLGVHLSHARLVSCTSSSVDLQFSPALKFQFSEATKPANRDAIQKELAAFAGAPVVLHITLEAGSGQDRAARAPSPKVLRGGSSIQDDIRNEPIIDTVLEIFDGEVL